MNVPRRFIIRAALCADLECLGVEPADLLMGHSSFPTVGPVLGGPDAIIAALRNASWLTANHPIDYAKGKSRRLAR